ncbi:hypothetical protein GGF46_003782 [Coemansia sp. RSA 552]|nr:hypothetical protein GGF46_003782 [Coemansia sp. RSA 552]
MISILVDLAAMFVFMSPTVILLLRRTFLPRFIAFEENIHAHMIASVTMIFWSAVHTGPVRRRLYEVFYYVHHLFLVFTVALFLHHYNHMTYKYLSGPIALYGVDRLYRVLRSLFAKSPIRAVIQHPSGVVEMQLDKKVFGHRVGQYVKVCCPSVSLLQWHPMTISSAPEDKLLTIHFRLDGGWTRDLAGRLGCKVTAKPRSSSTKQVVATSADISVPPLNIPYHPLHQDPTVAPMFARAGGNSSYVSIDMTTKGRHIKFHGTMPSSGPGALKSASTTALDSMAMPPPEGHLSLSRVESGELAVKGGSDLPTIFIDGPYPAPTEQLFEYEVSIMVAAGIGVTPAAAVLRSIYSQWLYNRDALRSKRVFLFWVYRDLHALEWFKDLLIAIEEEEGLCSVVQVHTYYTGPVSRRHNPRPAAGDHLFGKDIVDTPIGTESYIGRPDFGSVFEEIGTLYPHSRVGVFFCGPSPMGRSIRRSIRKWDRRLEGNTRAAVDFYAESFAV